MQLCDLTLVDHVLFQKLAARQSSEALTNRELESARVLALRPEQQEDRSDPLHRQNNGEESPQYFGKLNVLKRTEAIAASRSLVQLQWAAPRAKSAGVSRSSAASGQSILTRFGSLAMRAFAPAGPLS